MASHCHGGKRKGAGKPALFDAPMERKNIMLNEQSIEFLQKLGKGNLSAGIREAVRLLTTRRADAEKMRR